MEETGLKKEEEKRGTKQMKNAVKEAWVWNQRWEKDIFLFSTMPSGMLDLVSLPGIKALPPAMQVHSPNRWTTRKFSEKGRRNR